MIAIAIWILICCYEILVQLLLDKTMLNIIDSNYNKDSKILSRYIESVE